MRVKAKWAAWHEVVKVREDVRSGDLAMNTFAADLYDVVMGRARPVYQKPEEFFALTYPTFNLRELVKDVLVRLAGKNERAVRQLELTYGGGKTHALITLYHMVNDPAHLPNLPAVQEFRQHAGGMMPPKARIAVLPFDKFDVESGMDAVSPNGKSRRLRQPWSVIAYQIAGDEGLKLLNAENKAEERESPPAENLLRELISLPSKENLSTLILIDEVLTYAREKVALDARWRDKLVDFFQYLTQAVTKIDCACMVASLLATDPRKSDDLGKEIARDLHNIFLREQEQAVLPVEKQDVAEILRRRFFTHDSILDRESFRQHVVAALEGIQTLDDQTQKNRKAEEDRYLLSYPFHPDLTEAFYSKWTQLQNFQRTRGVLRTFAMALKDAEKWDTAPLISTSAFLVEPGKLEISEAARELASIARSEEYEGRTQDWSRILQGELEKACAIEKEYPAIKYRELEQAVMATFLHSQPAGQRAQTRELMVLVGATCPDRIELEKAIHEWAEVSWWLDEAALAEASGQLPKTWRLGTRPNLRQMLSQAILSVEPILIENEMVEFIRKEKRLTVGAGVRTHTLPKSPGDIEDDGDFHYVILGPSAASESGKPNPEATKYIREKTSSENKRTYQNAILLLTPSKDGLELLRDRVREYLGWQRVSGLPDAKTFDDTLKASLKAHIQASQQKIPDAVIQAYAIVVNVSDKGAVEAFKITPDEKPLFETIKADKRSRIQDSAISPDALLPDGPYNLWQKGETSRRANDLITAFAQFPHLPKMLKQSSIIDTISIGTEQGYFSLRLTRPDKSIKTFWRTHPSETDFQERELEVVLPQAIELTSLDSSLLAPGRIPSLWPENEVPTTVADVVQFFDGKHISKVKRQGYEETFPVPKVTRSVIETTINEAVKAGLIWLVSPPASIFREEIPLGVMNDAAVLNLPPEDIPATKLLRQNLPGAWGLQTFTTASALSQALSAECGKPLPWYTVSRAITAAIQGRFLERTPDSGAWPCDWTGAASIHLCMPEAVPIQPPTEQGYTTTAELQPSELQDFVESMDKIIKAGVGLNLHYILRLELGKSVKPTDEQLKKLNEVLNKACEKLKFDS